MEGFHEWFHPAQNSLEPSIVGPLEFIDAFLPNKMIRCDPPLAFPASPMVEGFPMRRIVEGDVFAKI